MRIKPTNWWIGPVTLALSVCIAAVPILMPAGTIDLGPLDLWRLVTRVAFDVGYADRYSIGVEMDQRVAKSLFPCTVDPDVFALHPEVSRRHPRFGLWACLQIDRQRKECISNHRDGRPTIGRRIWRLRHLHMASRRRRHAARNALPTLRPLRRRRNSFALSRASVGCVGDDPAFGDEQVCLAAFDLPLYLRSARSSELRIGLWRSRKSRARALAVRLSTLLRLSGRLVPGARQDARIRPPKSPPAAYPGTPRPAAPRPAGSRPRSGWRRARLRSRW